MRISVIFAAFGLALAASAPASAIGHWQGQQRALVILLEWANAPAQVDRATLEATFFGDGAGSTSARQFFLENSNGKFDLSGDVRDWHKIDKAFSQADGCDVDKIVKTAWDEVSAGIDVASYDTDHNGKIDNLFIVHSGRIGSDRVGPDCAFASHPKADHAIVFQSQGIGSIGAVVPIGFYIHEAGHGYFNFPDLYDDHYHGHYGIAMWGIMGLGAWGVNNSVPRDELFRMPAHFEPYSKVQIGWIEPRVIAKTTRGVVLRPVETSGDIAAVPLGAGENYYLEFRSDTGFSAGHAGHGLLIWKNYELVQADGRNDLDHGHDLGYRPLPPIAENFGDASDPFPGTDAVSSYKGEDGVSFENIKQFDDRIELDVVVTGARRREFRVDRMRDQWDGVERL